MWKFKSKNFIDGTMRIIKEIFYVRTDTQIPGVYYFVVYLPMLQWLDVWIMLVLSQVLYLKKNPADYTNKSTQARLNDDEEF